jgi:hypothetical protein
MSIYSIAKSNGLYSDRAIYDFLKDFVSLTFGSFFERSQALRFISGFPYANALEDAVLAGIRLLSDQSIPYHLRHWFVANKHTYLKPDPALAHELYQHWFKIAQEENLPHQILLDIAKYILAFYATGPNQNPTGDVDVRQDALDYLLDLTDSSEYKMEAYAVLIISGEMDEQLFARQSLESENATETEAKQKLSKLMFEIEGLDISTQLEQEIETRMNIVFKSLFSTQREEILKEDKNEFALDDFLYTCGFVHDLEQKYHKSLSAEEVQETYKLVVKKWCTCSSSE